MSLSPAVSTLCENPSQVFLDVAKLLLTYADNILRFPDEEKYRSIRIGNPTFSTKLLPVRGAVECLFEMGFEEAETHLVFPKSASVEQLKLVRESIAAERDQRLSGGSPLQQPAATASGPPQPAASASAPPQPAASASTPPRPAASASAPPQPAASASTPPRPAASASAPPRPAAPSSTPTPQPAQQPSSPSSMSFFVTLQSNFQHVLLYEDAELQQKARSAMPHQEMSSAAQNKLEEVRQADPGCKVGLEDFLVLELLRWFKQDFFSWVDSLPCSRCGGSTHNKGSLSPASEDLRWGAQRVENHFCSSCQLSTRFPRYNNPEKLLQTRRGRCGEWANCFTLCCRAVGLEARYIWDSTDHVWTEVFSPSQRRWLHCDPCENACDKPLLYEVGWGKKLAYILAFSRDQVVDVTWRYSCRHPEVLSRRTRVQEVWLLDTINRLNGLRQHPLSPDRKKELTERLLVELVEFISPKKPKAGELGGRNSGSLAWRMARGETGGAATSAQVSGFVFSPSEQEKSAQLLHVTYSVASDRYCRVSSGSETTQRWDQCVWSQEAVFRKLEADWKMVYLARTEGSTVGRVSWKFDLAAVGMKIQSVSIMASSQTFHSGRVCWLLQSDQFSTHFSADGSTRSFPGLGGASQLVVSAELSGGDGEAAWQHAQLFRRSLTEADEPSFEILIQLQDA